jgi:NADH-quinone oxidoreductase subunit J
LLAALQLLVYAGAVVVLFVFVIMMLGPAAEDTPALRGVVAKTAAAALMGMAALSLGAALAVFAPERAVIESCAPGQGAECQQFGGVIGFSADLFGDGVLPFELISILLTVAIVGAIAVARGHTVLEAEAAQRRRALDGAQRKPERDLAAGVAASGGQ